MSSHLETEPGASKVDGDDSRFIGSSEAEACTSEDDRDGSCLGSRGHGEVDGRSLQQSIALDRDGGKALVVNGRD